MTPTTNSHTPAQIGRFRILRVLGEGAQGVVYQGYDIQLERHVAIKTRLLSAGDEPEHSEHLLESARTASSLSHPNIVQVFEVGVHESEPYVVFEYIEGKNLADLLRDQGPLHEDRAVVMMSQILGGIAHVHANGFLHGDIKPANILVGDDGIPRVTDFGISRPARRAAGETVCSGTVQYMAPECVSAGQADYRSDVFALGLLFHEMLTGKAVYEAANDYARIYRILNEAVPAPSTIDARIDARLDAIVLKAVERLPQNRYADAGEMKAALDRHRVPRAGTSAADSTQSDTSENCTLSFLLRRMSLKTDFPALSASFGRINELTAKSDDQSLQAIADLVIRDFALTQKVLKIVNSAEFAFGKVTRVSQAISMMGVARLRSLAIGMMIASANRRGPRCPAIAAALTDFFVAGVIARNIGRIAGLKAVEELFICGMFSRLGQLLTLYYLKDEYDAIQRHIVDHSLDAGVASKKVMSMSYDELGIAIAQRWHFPDVIVSAMRTLPSGAIHPARDASERIRHCAAYARELCMLARIENVVDREAAFAAHLQRFANTIDVEPTQVRAILGYSIDAAAKYVAAAELEMSPTTLLDGLRLLASNAANEARVDTADSAAALAPTGEAATNIGTIRRTAPETLARPAAGPSGTMLAHA